MTTAPLDDWDDYVSGTFLKAINVDSEQEPFVCIDLEENIDTRSNPPVKRVRLTLSKGNGVDFEFDMNKTNSNKVRELGVATPRACIGKKFYFKKPLVRNPKTGQEVEGLRVWKVE